MFSFSIKALVASLICLQLERLGFFKWTYVLRVPDSHGSHTCYQRVQMRSNSLSQLGDEVLCLGLCQTMRVSIPKSAPPLNFQIGGRNITGPVALPADPPLSDDEEGPLLVLLVFVFYSADSLSITGPSFESILSSIRFSKRSIIESTFASKQALKRSAAFSRSAPTSAPLSSDSVRGDCHAPKPRVLLTEVLNRIDEVRWSWQFHVFSKTLNDCESAQVRASSICPISTQVRLLGVWPTVAAGRQYLVLRVSRALYHRRKRRRGNCRRDQSLRFLTAQFSTWFSKNPVTTQKLNSEGFLSQNVPWAVESVVRFTKSDVWICWSLFGGVLKWIRLLWIVIHRSRCLLACREYVFQTSFVALGPNQVAVGSFTSSKWWLRQFNLSKILFDIVLDCSALFFMF